MSIPENLSKPALLRARDVVKEHVEPTRLLEAGGFNSKLLMKLESEMPMVRAFKLRGALNALSNLPPDTLKQGVITKSSGNHGAALSLAAKIYQTQCHVVVPEDIRPSKLKNIQDQGGIVHFCAPNQRSREQVSELKAAQYALHFVHPYADLDVIAGQSTVIQELLAQTEGAMDKIVMPVGGGGLLAGSLLAAEYFTPSDHKPKIIGVEPTHASHLKNSLKKGGVSNLKVTRNTQADALRSGPLDINYQIASVLGAQVVDVSEDEIRQGSAWLDSLEVDHEISSAVVAAPILKRDVGLEFTERVALIITGNNK